VSALALGDDAMMSAVKVRDNMIKRIIVFFKVFSLPLIDKPCDF
jgi:hypothetical protein